ncbi:hypothetical protein QCA50_018969 [Cerrena zonata]|uniref:Transmembrane protein 188 n=1 Tax=Cerrena zonata TaxID=2478898 RepID=A0AAW0FEZ3_9APHY
MPPRPSPAPSRGSYYPTNDSSTYRDLLLFEERLKINAASLNRRKHRYQFLLLQLVLTILFLLSEVFLVTNFLATPCHWVVSSIVSESFVHDAEVLVHHYIAMGLLCISVTTLVLFFVSGMYSEKIAYANRYVPHANRALRSFNMYLNVRQPPLRSKLPFNPFSLLFPRTSPTAPQSPPSSPSSPRRRSPSPNRTTKRSSSVPISPIPPSSNPRGELIFSSKVDRSFRECYDRYRAAFERRRVEKDRAAYQATWTGWLHMKIFRIPPAQTSSGSAPSGTATPVSAGLSGPARTGSAAGNRGRGGNTPTSSRRSSPVPTRPSRMGRGATPPASASLDSS